MTPEEKFALLRRLVAEDSSISGEDVSSLTNFLDDLQNMQQWEEQWG